MPTCVAVTCWGWGDVWGFDSPEQARLHPLIDTCDVVLSSAEEVYPGNWNYLFLPRMCAEVLGDREACERLKETIREAPDARTRDSRVQLACVQIWNRLCDVAKQPPSDPRKICDMIVRDRRRTDEWHKREENRRSSVMNAQTQTADAGTTTKAPPAPKNIAGRAPTQKIAFGKDKDGKHYGKDNNPKRANSKSADRFNLYTAGMTLQQAVDKGCSAADIKWDLEHGYITAS
jgi:hypothetical protein